MKPEDFEGRGSFFWLADNGHAEECECVFEPGISSGDVCPGWYPTGTKEERIKLAEELYLEARRQLTSRQISEHEFLDRVRDIAHLALGEGGSGGVSRRPR